MVQGSNMGIAQMLGISIPIIYSEAGVNNHNTAPQTHEIYCKMDLGQNTIYNMTPLSNPLCWPRHSSTPLFNPIKVLGFPFSGAHIYSGEHLQVLGRQLGRFIASRNVVTVSFFKSSDLSFHPGAL